ncbi:MAG TPA: FmdB family zinc ribbon protein [Dissulfurispiraceae bacterium]|nr:FmdB family zinc ribbon protein [Dissulfurispiraceae bacterium]
MPIYEYGCQQCGHQFDIMQKFSDAPLSECPKCCGNLKKLISNTSFVLKGSGWYISDYASGDRKKAAEAEAKGSTGSDSDTKAETKTEPKPDVPKKSEEAA